MNVWIIKDTKFGYRYTTNKASRKIIIDYFNDYLFNILSSKSNKNDILVIAGGLFSNTNPSIVAINDAVDCLTKISKIINVILLSNDKDLRLFEGESYSTLSIFRNIPKVQILEHDGHITYNNSDIDINNGIINIDNKIIPIPIAIEFEKDDNNSGIYINREDGKYTVLSNKFSPKHITYKINDFSDFDNIKIDDNIVHLVINNKLTIENKSLLNINIFKCKPTSIKYIDDKEVNINDEDQNIEINTNFSIIQTINDNIEDDKVREQFERILRIYQK